MITQLQKAERTLLLKEGNADDLNYKAEDILAEMEDVVKQVTQANTELAKVKKADFLRLQGVYKSEVSRVFCAHSQVRRSDPRSAEKELGDWLPKPYGIPGRLPEDAEDQGGPHSWGAL